MIVNGSRATGALIFMRGANKAHKGACAAERGIISAQAQHHGTVDEDAFGATVASRNHAGTLPY